jgi:hypothetical protein
VLGTLQAAKILLLPTRLTINALFLLVALDLLTLSHVIVSQYAFPMHLFTILVTPVLKIVCLFVQKVLIFLETMQHRLAT